ncbi:MAG: class I SAM-dependent methyltransferase [Chloroflexi bacterium]|nr:class I SAM-dependent methyltransferase [Chloroflexota bacterium]
MDYRKPVTFGENWSPSRYKVLPYFAVEKEIIQRPSSRMILDLGCASGWNMSRFGQYGRASFGIDVVPERVQLALHHGPVAVASGLELPFADEIFDLIYIQHVLHHIGDVRQALGEVRRCLKPSGVLFLIETAEDNPIIRWGRRLYPNWLGDEINAPFYFADLKQQLTGGGFRVEKAEQYSVIFWLWEILPDQFPFMEKLTPLFVQIERVFVKLFGRQSAHCYYVAKKI